MGMTEDDKRNCCLLEIQETEAKYYKTLEDIEKVRTEPSLFYTIAFHPITPSCLNLAVLVLAVRAGRCDEAGSVHSDVKLQEEEEDTENPSWQAQMRSL